MVNRYIKNSILLLLIFISKVSIGQNLSSWSSEAIEKCNTAKNTNYLTEQEKKIVLLINLARTDGKLFYETIALPYMDTLPKTEYTRSLKKDLSKSINYPILSTDKILYDIAMNHAKTMGKSGKIGHDKFMDRTKHVRNSYYGIFENCDYGFNDALNIVMRLLIDEGTSSLGHRMAILNPEVYYIGVSIQPHTKWDYNCVQIFGGKKL